MYLIPLYPLQVLANAAGLASIVGATLEVTAASVILTAVFPVSTAAEADLAKTSLTTSMGSIADTQAFFAAAGVTVTVESAPEVTVIDAGGGLSAGVLAGIVVGALVGVGLVVGLVFRFRRRANPPNDVKQVNHGNGVSV